MTDVTPNLKPDGYGPCECGTDACYEWHADDVKRLGKPDKGGKRHVHGCKCPACRGRRNRRKGDTKAGKARKALNIGGVNSRHEELFGGALRIEVKAGKIVAPAVTAYERNRAQSEQSRSVGDNRPFAAVWMPDGSRDGVIACRLSDLTAVAVAVLENQAGA